MAICKDGLKKFEVEHAEEIAATRAEFVKFLREGDLPQESLDFVALYIFISQRSSLKHCPDKGILPAGNFFDSVVEDGVYDSIEYWDNPKKYAALTDCPMCDGEGRVPKSCRPQPVKTVSGSTEKRAKSVGRVKGI